MIEEDQETRRRSYRDAKERERPVGPAGGTGSVLSAGPQNRDRKFSERERIGAVGGFLSAADNVGAAPAGRCARRCLIASPADWWSITQSPAGSSAGARAVAAFLSAPPPARPAFRRRRRCRPPAGATTTTTGAGRPSARAKRRIHRIINPQRGDPSIVSYREPTPTPPGQCQCVPVRIGTRHEGPICPRSRPYRNRT